MIQNGFLSIPLYHGTSTLFVDSIVSHGLGGINVMERWNILELSREVLLLSETHLGDTDVFKIRHNSFRLMTEQTTNAQTNWQHGDTYLSSTVLTAVRYACNKRFGSELLTYTLDFLEELIRHEVAGIRDELFEKYPKAFSFLDASPSPVVIEASRVPVSALAAENGGSASKYLEFLAWSLEEYGEEPLPDYISGGPPHYTNAQMHFRFQGEPIPLEQLKFWLVNTLKHDPFTPVVKLYEIDVKIDN